MDGKAHSALEKHSELLRKEESGPVAVAVPVQAGQEKPFFSGPLPFVVLLIVALIGVFATSFLSYRHIMLVSNSAGIGDSILCRSDGRVSCDAILMTDYAVLFGYISSAALGLAGFVFVLWCTINALFNHRMRKLAWVLLVAYFFAAIGFSWYYMYIMIFQVDHICTWCIVVHILNAFALILVVWVSIRKKGDILLREIAPLGERVYFVIGGVVLSLAVLSAATMAEKSLTFDDLKMHYEELANDNAVIMAVIRSSPTLEVPVSPEDPVYGSPRAPYPIILFADFQCPGCAKIERSLKDVVDANPGLLRLVYKNYPLSKDCNDAVIAQRDFHPLACTAARAAYAAYLLGGPKAFWTYGELLFANQKRLRDDQWIGYAKQLNLDVNKFTELMKPDSPAAKKVQEDVKLGLKLQLNATPKIFFEGKRLPDNFGTAYLVDALEELLRDNHPEAADVRLLRR
ncbi:MAG: thioredoxin domain-containing protein [Desulfomonile tiedjei]|nr:thioredoxin domain-containing protein [Desulfomonile tiedjei]